MKTLSIDLIRTDGGTQMRAELNRDTYMEYRDVWLNSPEQFPPLIVFHDGAAYWLADGFHRFYGAREAKRASVPVDLRNGTQRDAILFAAGANDSHGLKRSPEDKKNTVRLLLADDDWGKRSSNWIAEACKINPHTAEKYRKEIEAESTVRAHSSTPVDAPTRTGKDGKKRKPPAKKPAKVKSADPIGDACPHEELDEDGDCLKCKKQNAKPKVSGGATFDTKEIEEAGPPKPPPAPPAPPPKRGKPTIDVRKFRELETEVGKIVRLNTALKEHCGCGIDHHENIRQNLNDILGTLSTWRQEVGAA